MKTGSFFFSVVHTESRCLFNDLANSCFTKANWGEKMVIPLSIPPTLSIDTGVPSFISTAWKMCILIPIGLLLRAIAFVCHSEVRSQFFSKYIEIKKPSAPFDWQAELKAPPFLKQTPPELFRLSGTEFFQYLSDQREGSCQHLWTKLKDPDLTIEMLMIPMYTDFLAHLQAQLKNNPIKSEGYGPLIEGLEGIKFLDSLPDQDIDKVCTKRMGEIAEYLQSLNDDNCDKARVYEYAAIIAVVSKYLPNVDYNSLKTKLRTLELTDCIPADQVIDYFYNKQQSELNSQGSLNLTNGATNENGLLASVHPEIEKSSLPFDWQAAVKASPFLKQTPPALFELSGKEFFQYLYDQREGSCQHLWTKLQDPDLMIEMSLIPMYSEFFEHVYNQVKDTSINHAEIEELEGIKTLKSLKKADIENAVLLRLQAINAYLQNLNPHNCDKGRVYEYTAVLAFLHKASRASFDYKALTQHLINLGLGDCIPDDQVIDYFSSKKLSEYRKSLDSADVARKEIATPFNLQARLKTSKLLKRVPPEVFQHKGIAFFQYISDNFDGSCKYLWAKLKDPKQFLDLASLPQYEKFWNHLSLQLQQNCFLLKTPDWASALKDFKGVEYLMSCTDQTQLMQSIVNRPSEIINYLNNLEKGFVVDKDLVSEYTFALKLLGEANSSINYASIVQHLTAIGLAECIPDSSVTQRLIRCECNKASVSYVNTPNLPKSRGLMALTGFEYFKSLCEKQKQANLESLIKCVQNFQLFYNYASSSDSGIKEVIQKHKDECVNFQIELLSGKFPTLEGDQPAFISQCLLVYHQIFDIELDEENLYEVIQYSEDQIKQLMDNHPMRCREYVVYIETQDASIRASSEYAAFLKKLEGIDFPMPIETGKEKLRALLPHPSLPKSEIKTVEAITALRSKEGSDYFEALFDSKESSVKEFATRVQDYGQLFSLMVSGNTALKEAINFHIKQCKIVTFQLLTESYSPSASRSPLIAKCLSASSNSRSASGELKNNLQEFLKHADLAHAYNKEAQFKTEIQILVSCLTFEIPDSINKADYQTLLKKLEQCGIPIPTEKKIEEFKKWIQNSPNPG
jgi:hypothetical protein